MSVSLYLDVHVPQAITDQLRRRGIDVITAGEDGSTTLMDEEWLQRAHSLGRLIFTQDKGFKALAEDWQRQNKQFSSLAFGPQMGGTIGQYVRDLELIAQASEPGDWLNTVEHLPY